MRPLTYYADLCSTHITVYWHIDGFSKVLFPISAKNRIPCVTPLVLLVKKVILKMQVKCSKSTSLEKKVVRFL